MFDGYQGMALSEQDREVVSSTNITRFGPTKTLSCLPELEKLAYLKLPLHFLISNMDAHFIHEYMSPENEGEALALVNTSFPPSLKRLDIVVYGFYLDEERVGEIYPLRTITVRF